MSQEVRKLEPSSLWNHFADLNAVPRPSKKEERVIAFMKSFGESLGLKTIVDEIGNVIIYKPGTAGYEDHTPVILQGHLDMVHQKNNDVNFDFDKEGIKMYIDGDWVKAEGTTLGADNGIGVAATMALLSSKDIPHPPLEALFTIDEETGMTGAAALQPGLLDGKILLNLDSEDDSEITIGCAGGIDVTVTKQYHEEIVREGHTGLIIKVKGLTGGHSGMDIHRGRGNANKLMNRLLWNAADTHDVHIHQINGGGLRNAIPRESTAHVWVKDADLAQVKATIQSEAQLIIKEYSTTDPSLEILVEAGNFGTAIMNREDQTALLNAIYAAPNGIYRLSPDVEDLVQTSNNLAHVSVKSGHIKIDNLTRSAVDSEKLDLAHAIQSCFQLMGAEVRLTGSYPGWAPDPHAKINAVLADAFERHYGKKPAILACHAGLECGIIKNAYPDVDMISFGPNIRGAHSPDEKVQISSVAKFWELLKKVLKDL